MVLERVVDADNVGSAFVMLKPSAPTPSCSVLAVAILSIRNAIRTSSGAALMVLFAAAEPWPGALTVCERWLHDRCDDARRQRHRYW